MSPIAGDVLHVLAYLTDALAPVWHLPIMDAQLLKRQHRPFFPALQADVDWLVGAGIVAVESFGYVEEGPTAGGWRLAATYSLLRGASEPILQLTQELAGQKRKSEFVREVVLAATGLGDDALARLGDLDAAYSEVRVDVGGVLDLATERPENPTEEPRLNSTAAVAARFARLAGAEFELSAAEMVHLYVRHLYTRIKVA